MKCAVHIYVEHKGNDNAEEADVGEFEEENVGGAKQVEEDNVGGVVHVEEANVGDVEQIEEDHVGGVEQFEDTEDNDDSDFEPDGLSFDDSEHERDPGLDDCFDFIENQVEENGKRGRIKVATRKHNHTPKKVPIGVDNVGSCGVMDNEIIINYASDELGSSVTLMLLMGRRNQNIQGLRCKIWTRITNSKWDWSLYHLKNLKKQQLNDQY